MDDERYERFDHDVAELRVGDAVTRERRLGRLGLITAIAGPVVGLIAYIGSMSADDPLAQRDMIVLGLLGVSLTILGVGLFIRYSAIRFFRYWAARTVFEISRSTRTGSDDHTLVG
jgi:hypothetical protein